MLKVEDLKCFEFECGESEWVLARNKEEAIKYYKTLVGDEVNDYVITEIQDWHDMKVKVEETNEYRNMTYLDYAKEDFDNENFEPYVISTTCY